MKVTELQEATGFKPISQLPNTLHILLNCAKQYKRRKGAVLDTCGFDPPESTTPLLGIQSFYVFVGPVLPHCQVSKSFLRFKGKLHI